jgi:hypothetical protein|nr:MAG TPA: hypothetical protein [Bacteriophage sp.]
MVPINIDISSLIEEFSLDENQTLMIGTTIIDRVAQEYSYRWKNLIDKELKSSRNEYLRGIFIERVNPTEIIFGLSNRESSLPLSIEEGHGPWNEKPFLLGSLKAKRTKDGKPFLTVPFRHATPQAIAEAGIFSSIMPQDVYQLAKNSPMPLKRSQLPESQQIPGVRKEINIPGLKVPEYIHKAAKYEGLVRVEASSSENENRGQYMTFRRVSDKSDPNSWFNGGIIAKRLMDRALEIAQIDRVADMAIDETLERILNNK